jgi:hypothetical protein
VLMNMLTSVLRVSQTSTVTTKRPVVLSPPLLPRMSALLIVSRVNYSLITAPLLLLPGTRGKESESALAAPLSSGLAAGGIFQDILNGKESSHLIPVNHITVFLHCSSQ